ncbi:MAG: PQQ-binding-like beta-propeller repeat protein [Planctomycetota bacterium]
MRTVRLSALLLSLSVLLPHSLGSLTAADWPMLGRDVRRSHSTPDDVAPPYRRAWVQYLHEFGISPFAQPVIADQKIILGLLNGNVRAFALETGLTAWSTFINTPILETACVTSDGLVVLGALDGRVYGLQLASGDVAWRTRTRGALCCAPVASGSLVYIGGRDGVFYALETKTGKIAWTVSAGAPIVQAPVVDTKRQRVYFTPESGTLHVVDSKSGDVLKRVPLGHSPRAGSYLHLRDDGTLLSRSEGGLFVVDPKSFAVRRVDGRISPLFSMGGKTLALRQGSGLEIDLLDFDSKAAKSSALTPPRPWRTTHSFHSVATPKRTLVVAGEDSSRLLSFRSGETQLSPLYSTGRSLGDDLSFRHVLDGSPRSIPEGRENLPAWVGIGKDMARGRLTAPARAPAISGEFVVWAAGAKLLALRSGTSAKKATPPPPVAPGTPEVVHRQWPIQWDRFPDSFRTGRPDWLSAVTGSALEPDVDHSKAPSQEVLDEAIWFGYEIPDRDAEGLESLLRLRLRLEKEVSRVLEHAEWRPHRRSGSVNAELSFDDPSAPLIALAYAYPFLETKTRRAARKWVLDYAQAVGSIVTKPYLNAGKGTRREFGPDSRLKEYDSLVRSPGVERAYGIWAWSYLSDDWTLAERSWKELQELTPPSTTPRRDEGNALCSGLIAMARIARELNDETTEERFDIAARKALIARTSLDLRYPRGRVMAPQIEGRFGWSRWTWLSPEVARFLRRESRDTTLLVRYWLQVMYPYAHIVGGPPAPNSTAERRQSLRNAHTASKARLLFQELESPETLSELVDIPACQADFYWIERAALALFLAADPGWADLR